MPLGHQNDLGKLPANMALVENRWSLSFDGDDYLEIHSDDDEAFSGRLAVSTLSLAFWVKPANLDDKYPIFSVGTADDNQFTVAIKTDGKVEVKLVNEVHTTSSACFAGGAWSYLVVRYDGSGTPTIKVDSGTGNSLSLNKLSATTNVPSSIPNFLGNPMMIGNFAPALTGHDTCFEGLINNAFMWHTTLTEADVTFLYSNLDRYIANPFKDDLVNSYTAGNKSHWWWGMGDGYEQGGLVDQDDVDVIFNSASLYNPFNTAGVSTWNIYHMIMQGDPTFASVESSSANVPSASD